MVAVGYALGGATPLCLAPLPQRWEVRLLYSWLLIISRIYPRSSDAVQVLATFDANSSYSP